MSITGAAHAGSRALGRLWRAPGRQAASDYFTSLQWGFTVLVSSSGGVGGTEPEVGALGLEPVRLQCGLRMFTFLFASLIATLGLGYGRIE